MADNTTESKLDETVKNTLNTYEDPLDAGDWARMEAMLNAAPKTNTFRWTFPLTASIGIAILSGGIIIYNTIRLKNTSTESAVETPQPFEKRAVPQKTLPLVPSFTKTEIPVISSPVKKELPAVKIKEKNISSVNKTTPNTNGSNTSTADALEKDSTKETKKNVKESTIDKDSSKKQSVSVMGNEPIFGDMIDSSKGVIYETKEKNTTKKAAKSKSNTPIGWDLLNQNIDSVKKQSQQMKKDSIP